MRAFLLLFAACGAAQGQGSPDAQPPPSPSSATPRMSVARVGAEEPGLGANVTPLGVMFRVWAPSASAARVVFGAQTVAMTAEADGVFAATVADAHAGTNYS